MDGSTPPRGNACAGLSQEDRDALRGAAEMLLDARGIIIKATEAIGRAMGAVGGSASGFLREKFGIDVAAKAEEIAADLLRALFSGATAGMDPEREAEGWHWFHKLVAVASGVSAGIVGAPGLAWDLPVTTGVILRSVADIARTYPGESLETEGTRRACVEVFMFGGPDGDDDNADTGYWLGRTGLSHAAIEEAIKRAAARLGVVMSEKLLAQVVPIAGAVAGGGLNYAFIDYYQQMARVHFTIRGVERRSRDASAVRACFSEQVRRLREERKFRKP